MTTHAPFRQTYSAPSRQSRADALARPVRLLDDVEVTRLALASLPISTSDRLSQSRWPFRASVIGSMGRRRQQREGDDTESEAVLAHAVIVTGATSQNHPEPPARKTACRRQANRRTRPTASRQSSLKRSQFTTRALNQRFDPTRTFRLRSSLPQRALRADRHPASSLASDALELRISDGDALELVPVPIPTATIKEVPEETDHLRRGPIHSPLAAPQHGLSGGSLQASGSSGLGLLRPGGDKLPCTDITRLDFVGSADCCPQTGAAAVRSVTQNVCPDDVRRRERKKKPRQRERPGLRTLNSEDVRPPRACRRELWRGARRPGP